MAIARIWRGWTSSKNGPAFEAILTEHVLPEIRSSKLPGLIGLAVLKRPEGQETEYQTILVFHDLAAISSFAGTDVERAHLDARALPLLSHYDERVRHYEIVYHTR